MCVSVALTHTCRYTYMDTDTYSTDTHIQKYTSICHTHTYIFILSNIHMYIYRHMLAHVEVLTIVNSNKHYKTINLN